MTAEMQIPADRARLTREQSIWRWRILISTYAGYAAFYLTRKVFTICKKPIADDFNWSLQSMSHIWTAFLVSYMLGQFINSYFGRRYGPRVLLLGGLGLSIACNVVFGFSNSYNTFLVFMMFNGLFQAAGWPGSVGAVSHWLRPFERGSVMGIWSTNYQIGEMAVKYFGGALLGITGLAFSSWRLSFFGCTLIACAVWGLIYVWQRNRPEDVGLPPVSSEDEVEVRTIHSASQEDHVGFLQYVRLAFHPLVLTMGISYFCIKFPRYAIDSWLPAFLNIKGLSPEHASYYSGIFQIGGLGGAVFAGFCVDRFFKGNWAAVCLMMGLGSVAGYILVLTYGGDARTLAWCFGFVGLMTFGPDTLLSGVAAIQVAGRKNGVALAGIVNGIASLGPVLQEELIGYLTRDGEMAAIHKTNVLLLSMSICFSCIMLIVLWRLRLSNRHAASMSTNDAI